MSKNLFWLAGAATLFAILPALSRSDGPSKPGYYQSVSLKNWFAHLGEADSSTAAYPAVGCSGAGCAQFDAPSKACVDAYKKLYRDDSLKIRVFLGYMNDVPPHPGDAVEDLVFDRYIRELFVGLLTTPCSRDSHLHACGFDRDPSPASENTVNLFKRIRGPDGNSKDIELTLESTSATESDAANRHGSKDKQHRATRQIERDFADALRGTDPLKSADVVLYAGHARHGTGPALKPLPTLSLGALEAFLFHPALKRLLKALSTPDGHPPALIGIYSCHAETYYGEAIHKADPSAALAMSFGSMPVEETHEQALGTLNALLGMECEGDFAQAIPRATLSGFFNSN